MKRVSTESKTYMNHYYLILSIFTGLVILIQFIIEFSFFNFQANLLLFGIGWFLLPIGFWLVASSIVSLRRNGGISESSSISKTDVLVTTGFYSILRNPIYLGAGIFSLALAFVTQNWLSMGCSIVVIPLLANLIVEEETLNKIKFGDEYLSYMNSIPRVNLFLGLWNHFRKEMQNQD